MNLSNHIYRASRKYKVPANIYTAILMQESGYRLSAINTIKGVKPVYSMFHANYCLHKRDKEGVKFEECIEKYKPIRYDSVSSHVDFGIAQINHVTAKSHKMDIHALTRNLSYSIDAGARVLSYFHKRYAHKEYDWWVRYNVGTRPKKRVRVLWDQYKTLVSRYL